jgi:hypothetical protein
MKSTEADRKTVQRVQGIYEGLLTPEEVESFDRCCEDRIAYRDYNHAAGMLGLARVSLSSEDRS